MEVPNTWLQAKALAALASPDSWRDYMASPARRLCERLQEESFGDEWPRCRWCKRVFTVDHLTSGKHFKQVAWESRSSEGALQDGCDVLQVFEAKGSSFTFNHLTGALMEGLVYANTAELNAGDARLRDKVELGTVMGSREAWEEHITEGCEALGRAMRREHKATGKRLFHCAVCSRGHDGNLDICSHLASNAHLKAVWSLFRPKFKPPSWWDACGRSSRWVQDFRCSDGVFWFNHVTGEYGFDAPGDVNRRSSHSLPPPFPAGSRPSPPLSSQDHSRAWSKEHTAEPVRKFAFVGNLAIPSSDWPGCATAWEAASLAEAGAHEWTVQVEPGEYTVILGFDLPAGTKQLKGQVQGVGFGMDGLRHRNVERSVDVVHPGGAFTIGGPNVPHLIWVQVWVQRGRGILRVPIHVPTYTQAPVRPPNFHEGSTGRAGDWNVPQQHAYGQVLRWGAKAKQVFGALPRAVEPDINSMLAFLDVRTLESGGSLLTGLGPPVRHRHGWYSLTLRDFSRSKDERLAAEGWVRAWHGCKMEGVYSTIYNGRLFESRDEDGTSHKASNYNRFVNLFNDGVFWAAKWELRVEDPDPLCRRESGVQLVALWLCGRNVEQMESGWAVSRRWIPLLEDDPRSSNDAKEDSSWQGWGSNDGGCAASHFDGWGHKDTSWRSSSSKDDRRANSSWESWGGQDVPSIAKQLITNRRLDTTGSDSEEE